MSSTAARYSLQIAIHDIWARLTHPPDELTNSEDRRRMQMLRMLSLMFFSLGMVGVLWRGITKSASIDIVFLLYNLAMYFLASSRFYRWSIRLFLFLNFFFNIFLLVNNGLQTLPYLLVTLPLVNLFTTTAEANKIARLLFGVTLLTTIVLVVQTSQMIAPVPVNRLSALTMLGIITIMAHAFVFQQDRREIERQAKKSDGIAAQQQAILNSIPGIVTTIDRDGRILSINSGSNIGYESTLDAMIGTRFDQFMPTDYQ
ncbi:MAG TPA: PAS domain-containing protein, partial [Phototrophicaceae bacterium]|nr:PAS domain-containing protein [Phototrophicaceae bacterium]